VAVDANLDDPNHPQLSRINDKLALVFQARPSIVNGEANAPADQELSWSKLNVYFRQIDNTGALTPPQRISHANGSATYPALLYESPDHLFVTWTEGYDDGSQIVMARGRIATSAPATSRSDNGKPNTVAGKGGSND
jgi:hypothetical protein